MIDLKETKRLKNLLQESPQNYAEIIEDTYLAICITDKKGDYLAVNENYCIVYGFRKSELIGKSFTIVVPEEHRETLQRTHDNFLKHKFEILREWEVQNRKGELIKIYADAAYNDQINQSPHKITFVQPKEESLLQFLKNNLSAKAEA